MVGEIKPTPGSPEGAAALQMAFDKLQAQMDNLTGRGLGPHGIMADAVDGYRAAQDRRRELEETIAAEDPAEVIAPTSPFDASGRRVRDWQPGDTVYGRGGRR